MIDDKTLDIKWIKELSVQNRNTDKILIEKVIRALYLLEGLAKVKLDFVFKGGTALMLLMDSSKRLSIDIDIITENEPDNLEAKFRDILAKQKFTRFELQNRTSESKIKKAHYKFYYNPIHRTHSTEEYILLDILFEKPNYQHIIEIPIKSKFIVADDEEIKVKIPSHNDILGDKLTAFAPNTTGIPYFKGQNSMSMEIMKQLYDVGNLIDMADDMGVISSTFRKFAETELNYREQEKLKYKEVLEDIFQTSLCLVSRGAGGNGNFTELQNGIKRVSRFIFSEPFHLDIAIGLASKVAYVVKAIQYEKEEIEKFNDPQQIKDWTIKNPVWPRLNKLKKSNPEAFFYWYKAHQLIAKK